MADLYEKYIWEVPVRVTHWVIALSIVTLSLTGLFIGAPKSVALVTDEFTMGWVRFTHFVAGYAFAVSVVSRIYWSFVGNEQASWREFFPWRNKKGRQDMYNVFNYYTFVSKRAPYTIGHNALAGLAYSVVFLLYIVMIITGFALYSEHAPHGFLHHIFGPVLHIFTNQGVRMTHHLIMWFLIAFAIHHVYSAWLMDIKERGGVMSSIFGGYKPVHKKD
ncbi:Ni/Fe-hydrogenase, b-type cytochrome subunit [Geomesophilobacter sediminis]|uniref:Ni/Fe-hydrogenase, b-type cytochrome subunit n=1 Tax=Geomesophilobacter sediminis TaxID=2798584 RepID=A0A8J7M336_9BACT|nr:Ni/Fe-hydrogenase, b-type cytochrome subunit [Geomesophilobacter sediminis]MBJ6727849.1 Ni/Fe-hydrogenase, b-type cytochrome subunit [Geomesophilobacter sediminis]